MRVLVKSPRCPLHVEYVASNIEALQELVRGYVEVIPVNEDVCIICDEEARMKNKAYNLTFNDKNIFGRIAFVGIDGDEFVEVNYKLDKQIKEIVEVASGIPFKG